MKQQLIKFLIRLIPFTTVLFIIQYFIIYKLLPETAFYYSLFAIYAFHFLATLIIYIFLLFVHNNFSDKTGFAYMGASLLKMLAAIIFLLPLMLSDIPKPFENIIAFFIPYFLYLTFETLYAVKLINSK